MSTTKKMHFTYRQPDGEEHLGFKDSGNNELESLEN